MIIVVQQRRYMGMPEGDPWAFWAEEEPDRENGLSQFVYATVEEMRAAGWRDVEIAPTEE